MGLIRQQQPGIAADAICAVLESSMQPSSDASHPAQTVSGGASAPVVACAAASGVVATASASGMESGGAAISPSHLTRPRAPTVPLAPAAARTDGCQLHVDISGRSAAAATQTRPPPPPMLFDDFSAWADDGYGRAHPVAPNQQLPLLPPPGVLRTQQHETPAAPPASMARTAFGDAASSPGLGEQHPASRHRQQQQQPQQQRRPASVAASSRRYGPSSSAVPLPPMGTPLQTCRICHRLLPAPLLSEQRHGSTAAAAAGGGSSRGRSPAARSLEADVARALVSTLQRPYSGSALRTVRHATHRTYCTRATQEYTYKAPCTWRQSYDEHIVVKADNMLRLADGRFSRASV